ncbi:transglycosylase domain-containing protein [Chryseosolibacter indicus]|uniref:Transglycosylase domain-containing protein n=1 Tax=Chryseosolibacter indicus TaxID=2782351 RepID=A0ABS5VMJ7_9BACT|nr:transglycosylase domain-containing protein [Chryseosolibacter indicus]MBT1702673.1 transglycosylase domain-containing protein [Chryseosolibacter indicus]
MSTSASSKKTTPKKTNSILSVKKPWFDKIIKAVWILFFCFVLGIPLYFLSVSINLFGLFGEMPSTKEVENPENDLSSELISADGVSLGRYFRFNRSQVTYDGLSTDLVNTFMLSEDHRFYEHSGMDFWAYPRVLWGLLTLNSAGGGSTITQQLAKNLYTRNPDKALDGVVAKLGKYPRRIVQKTKEWIISVDLEKNFTKEEIIAMYLNTAEFSSNSYGIKVAAETYFNKGPDSLNLQESALLIGMLQNPTFYNPVSNPEGALNKRNEVLYKVYRHGYKIISREQYDSIKALPLGLNFKVQNQNQGLATYFRTVLRNDLMSWCKEHGYDLWESGLKIYTTIDSRMQRFAEEAMAEHMRVLQKEFDRQWRLRNRNPWTDENGNEIKNFLEQRIKRTEAYANLVERYGAEASFDSIKILLNQKKPMRVFTWRGERDTLFSSIDSLNYYKRFLQSGLMSMNPETGAIKAWVGGINHKYFKYDHVKQGSRQPGSTFKPFVYGKAIEDGYSPCHELLDISPTIKIPGGTWSPSNAEGDKGLGDKLTLRQALARSKNTISAQLIDRVRPQNVVEFAHRLGIKSELHPNPSLCLGVDNVTLYELVSAYCGFVNLGIHVEPYYITRIEDKNGNVIESFVPKTRQAMDEKTAYKMVYMLEGGVQESGGTSVGLKYELKKDNEIGGKTGTTDNASDGWYMGITHNLVTGVWVGGDEPSIRFPSWSFGAGSKTARPIWEKYMLKVYANPEVGFAKGYFKRPVSGLDVTLDCNKYQSIDSTEVSPDEKEITLDDLNN